jgi:putative addiction module killer protein
MGYSSSSLSVFTTEVFDNWFAALRDTKTRARIQARIDRLEMGNCGDCKSVGGGVTELRINYGPGYRVYCTWRKGIVVVLLCAGDKSTQQMDIRRAKVLASGLDLE